jgi:DNA-binding transcriptional regulator PaaX
MNVKAQTKTVLQLEIENAALRDAWRNQCCFKIGQFCKKFGFKDTRQLRAILRNMAGAGDLYEFREGNNKNTPLYYCAQKTSMMTIFEGELKK